MFVLHSDLEKKSTRLRSYAMRHSMAVALAIGIAFNTASYAAYLGKAQSVAKRLEQGLEKWENLGRGLRHPHPAQANDILAAAVRDGLYHPPLSSR